jgi:hypothetical protein
MSQELDWKSIEIGKKYNYEEGYHLQAEVEVLDKNHGDNDYIEYKLKIIKSVWGCDEGIVITVGKSVDPKFEYLSSNMKFKKLGSDYDYVTPGNPIENYYKR